jgi:meiotically up-regulated gene 157 (Mug157) protein
MAIGGMHPVAHKHKWPTSYKDVKRPEGAVFKIEGDSAAMWIKDYNVRVSTYAEVIKQPLNTDKKVLVRLDYIDHDSNVFVYIKKGALKEESRLK